MWRHQQAPLNLRHKPIQPVFHNKRYGSEQSGLLKTAQHIKDHPTHWLFSSLNIILLVVRVFLEIPTVDAYEVEYIVSGAMILMRNVTRSFEKSLGKLAFNGNCFHLPHIEFTSFYRTPKHGYFFGALRRVGKVNYCWGQEGEPQCIVASQAFSVGSDPHCHPAQPLISTSAPLLHS